MCSRFFFLSLPPLHSSFLQFCFHMEIHMNRHKNWFAFGKLKNQLWIRNQMCQFYKLVITRTKKESEFWIRIALKVHIFLKISFSTGLYSCAKRWKGEKVESESKINDIWPRSGWLFLDYSNLWIIYGWVVVSFPRFFSFFLFFLYFAQTFANLKWRTELCT